MSSFDVDVWRTPQTHTQGKLKMQRDAANDGGETPRTGGDAAMRRNNEAEMRRGAATDAAGRCDMAAAMRR